LKLETAIELDAGIVLSHLGADGVLSCDHLPFRIDAHVGKTRFLPALFDGRVGENAIDPSLAVYANVAKDADPQLTALANDLIAASKRQILVIDNCTSASAAAPEYMPVPAKQVEPDQRGIRRARRSA
jgi:hypothetical protein